MELHDWEKIKLIKISDTVFIDDIIPEKNEIKHDIVVCRTEKKDFEKKQWCQIKDKKVPSDISKKNYVISYFSTCVFLLKRVKSLSISANQSYRKTIEVSHTSTL